MWFENKEEEIIKISILNQDFQENIHKIRRLNESGSVLKSINVRVFNIW